MKKETKKTKVKIIKKKENDYTKWFIIGAIILLLLLVIWFVAIKNVNNKPIENKDANVETTEEEIEEVFGDDTRNKENVKSAEEIRKRLGINIDMVASSSIGYFIEDEDIARIEYSARGMDFTLKSSSDSNKNLANLNHNWDIPITMTSICEDGSDIGVSAHVAIDNPRVMFAEWYDNDLYYSMDTKNLTTREDFLQEVNAIIIKYHEEFY